MGITNDKVFSEILPSIRRGFLEVESIKVYSSQFLCGIEIRSTRNYCTHFSRNSFSGSLTSEIRSLRLHFRHQAQAHQQLHFSLSATIPERFVQRPLGREEVG